MTEPLASRAGRVSYEGGSATLKFERHIRHPIEDVWIAITGSEHLQRWYMSKAIIEGRKDGRIELWRQCAGSRDGTHPHVGSAARLRARAQHGAAKRDPNRREEHPPVGAHARGWRHAATLDPLAPRATDGHSDRARYPCALGQARGRAQPGATSRFPPQDCRGPESLLSAQRVTPIPGRRRGIEPPTPPYDAFTGPPTPRRSLLPGPLPRRGSRGRSTGASPSARAAAFRGGGSS